ncbi:N-acetylmuramoyl-L-alanine amidase [Azospirillum sp. TSO22-1]|uniref:N-acetylmuramoyl-L-alanine amidase family protein n=1 Tax=Azospirillum sp. TSO22-1 TaxID=716789 RepID=UPI000D609B10|nr:N-acetylmuramoyl-L-alanine amidase [Azospirillum sp. TSO22-1]PWC38640.1 N-acetylmuramoyl-L-alanine amidase [Azospirillum sp. TSO22-1]
MNRRLLVNLLWSLPLAGGFTRTALAVPALAPRRAGVPVVVLDPGHGGADPGAIGPHGTREKDVTLDIAREMAQRLTREHQVKVVLTREADRFLAIDERVEIGRAAQADLFVSIHADSAPTKEARGLSAYTLSAKATDGFAGALASRENRADAVAGVDLKGAKPEVRAILMDLATRHTAKASLVARQSIVKGAGRELRLLDNPMRAANFAVLKAPDVPSVLVETGFLSNPEDEQALRTADARRTVARVLARELAAVLARAPFA